VCNPGAASVGLSQPNTRLEVCIAGGKAKSAHGVRAVPGALELSFPWCPAMDVGTSVAGHGRLPEVEVAGCDGHHNLTRSERSGENSARPDPPKKELDRA
jgi:hypothetical protein